MRILYTLFLTAMVAIAMERCRGKYLLVAVEDDDDFRKPKNDDDFRKPENDDLRAEKSRGCWDCGFIWDGICCKFDNGTERCAPRENCPTYGKDNRVTNKIDCEKIKEELLDNNNGGEHLVCNPKGKQTCSTLKLSSTEVANQNQSSIVKDALAGAYQFIGEWKNVGSPIYRQVDGDPTSIWVNKFYLYYSSKQWFLQRESIGASKIDDVVSYSKHCKVDDYEDCSGKWKVYRTTESYNINIECEGALPTNDNQSAYDCCRAAGVHVLCIGLCLKDLKELKSRSLWEIPSVCSNHETAIKKCRQPDVPKMKEIPAVKGVKNAWCEGRPTFGFCKRAISGFTFDPVTKTCKSYDDSGCGETKNSYRTLEECETKCKSDMQSRTLCHGIPCPSGTICCYETDTCESSCL